MNLQINCPQKQIIAHSNTPRYSVERCLISHIRLIPHTKKNLLDDYPSLLVADFLPFSVYSNSYSLPSRLQICRNFWIMPTAIWSLLEWNGIRVTHPFCFLFIDWVLACHFCWHFFYLSLCSLPWIQLISRSNFRQIASPHIILFTWHFFSLQLPLQQPLKSFYAAKTCASIYLFTYYLFFRYYDLTFREVRQLD